MIFSCFISIPSSIATIQSRIMRRLLLAMTKNNKFQQFAVPQFKSLVRNCPISLNILLQEQLQGKQYQNDNQITHLSFRNFPFVIINVPDFSIHQNYFYKTFRHSVLINKIILLIAEGKSYDELIANKSQTVVQQFVDSHSEYMIEFMSRNRKTQKEYQLSKIQRIVREMRIEGKVNLNNARTRYHLVQNHEWYDGHHMHPQSSTIKQIYFGLQISNNHNNSRKINQFQTNKRIYLGPTSIGSELAFLMCHQALIQQNSIVVDPFVGTGGLLLAAASLGAITYGADLDYRVINGTSVGRINIKSPYFTQGRNLGNYKPKINLNFQQYNLPIPNIIRADSNNLPLRQGEHFDCIVTDPPYGYRATSISAQSQDSTIQIVSQNQNLNNKHQTSQNVLGSLNKQSSKHQLDKKNLKNCEQKVIIQNLIQLARRNLKKTGRLVFLYPILKGTNFQGVPSLPKWQGFRIIDASQNKIQGIFSRVLITLQKQ